MEDSYRRFGATTDNTTSLPGYVKPQAFPITSQSPVTYYDPLIDSYDFPLKDAGNGSDSVMGIGVRRQSGFRGYAAGESLKGYPSNMGDPYVPSIPGIANKRHDSSKTSNILFVDGIPSDCTRRELSHIFRPFHGFRDIKVVHKEPRTRGEKPRVLCFVEFADANCALTALEALQGYKFDNKKPDLHALKLHYARFPFRLPSDGNRQHHTVSSVKPTDNLVGGAFDEVIKSNMFIVWQIMLNHVRAWGMASRRPRGGSPNPSSSPQSGPGSWFFVRG